MLLEKSYSLSKSWKNAFFHNVDMFEQLYLCRFLTNLKSAHGIWKVIKLPLKWDVAKVNTSIQSPSALIQKKLKNDNFAIFHPPSLPPHNRGLGYRALHNFFMKSTCLDLKNATLRVKKYAPVPELQIFEYYAKIGKNGYFWTFEGPKIGP